MLPRLLLYSSIAIVVLLIAVRCASPLEPDTERLESPLDVRRDPGPTKLVAFATQINVSEREKRVFFEDSIYPCWVLPTDTHFVWISGGCIRSAIPEGRELHLNSFTIKIDSLPADGKQRPLVEILNYHGAFSFVMANRDANDSTVLHTQLHTLRRNSQDFSGSIKCTKLTAKSLIEVDMEFTVKDAEQNNELTCRLRFLLAWQQDN